MSTSRTAAFTAIGVGALFAASGITGFGKTSSCREAKDQLVERASQHPGAYGAPGFAPASLLRLRCARGDARALRSVAGAAGRRRAARHGAAGPTRGPRARGRPRAAAAFDADLDGGAPPTP